MKEGLNLVVLNRFGILYFSLLATNDHNFTFDRTSTEEE